MTGFTLEPGSLLEVLSHPSSCNSPAITCLREHIQERVCLFRFLMSIHAAQEQLWLAPLWQVNWLCLSSSCPSVTYGLQSDGSRETVTYSELHRTVVQLCDELCLRHERQLLVVVCGYMGPSSVALLLAALHSNAYYYLHPDLIRLQSTYRLISCVAPALIAVAENCCSEVSWLQTDFSYVKSVGVFNSKFLIYTPVKPRSFSCGAYMRGLAYAITTSGSTGAPKIVFVPRSCIAPNVQDLVRKCELMDKDVIFSAAPLSFDPCIVNILMSLCSAAHLVVATKEMVPSVRIVDCLLNMRVTFLQMTPSLLSLWHRQKNLSECLLREGSSVRILALGGEPVPIALLESIEKDLRNVDLYSLYGITEVSSWSAIKKLSLKCAKNTRKLKNLRTVATVDQNTSQNFLALMNELDLGDLLSETSLCLVKDGTVCEDGNEGEIFLGRKNSCSVFELVNTTGPFDELSKSSTADRPQLKSIQSNIVWNGMTMYPSGDLGCIKNEVFYFRGRKNREVKIFGQRLNLRSLEDVCMSVPGVTACRFTSDSNHLFGFYTTDAGDQVMVEACVRSAILSVTRVPCTISCLPRLPLNSHAKVDDRQLMKGVRRTTSNCVTEKHFMELVDKLWFEFCHCVPKLDSSFIALGLDSLRAVEFLESLQEQVNVNFLGALDSLLNDNYGTVVQVLRSLLHTSHEVEDHRMSPAFKDISAKKRKLFHGNFARVILSKLHILIGGVETPVEECILPVNTNLVWSLNLAKCIDASPVLVLKDNDCLEPLLFIGSHSRQFCCVNALSGTVKWSVTLEARMEASPAVNSSATQVYAACYAGFLYCFSVSSGDLLWKFKAGAEIKCSPVLDYETEKLYFGSHDKYFYCLEPDGTLSWKAFHSGGSIFASPCVSGVVYVACLKGIVGCYDKDSGEVLWRHNLNAPVFASLVNFSRGVLCASVDRRLTALSSSGSVLWCYELKNQCYCTPRVLRLPQRDLICLGDNSGTVHLICGSGRKLSHLDLGCRVVATPFLYFFSGTVIAALASTNGKIVFCKFSEKRIFNSLPKEKYSRRERFSVERATSYKNCEQNNRVSENITFASESRTFPREFTDNVKKNEQEATESQADDEFPTWSFSLVYELSYPGEIFSSPLVYQNHLFICGRENTVQCYKL